MFKILLEAILDLISNNKAETILGIVTSAIGLVCWFFKSKKPKVHQEIKEGASSYQMAGDVGQVQTSGNNSESTQVFGDQTNIYKVSEEQLPQIIKAVSDVILAKYPVAHQNAQRNIANFSKELEPKLSSLTKTDLQNLGDPDVVAVLMLAMGESARTDEAEIHQVLSESIAQRMRMGKANIMRLSFNQAVEVILKLDSNLLKLLSLLFIIHQIRAPSYLAIDKVVSYYIKFFLHLDAVKISDSSVDYLQSVGCGLPQAFGAIKIGGIMLKEQKHLFYNSIPLNELDLLEISHPLKQVMFKKTSDIFNINTSILYAVENGFDNISFHGPHAEQEIFLVQSMSDEDKNKILAFVKKYRMKPEDVEQCFLEKMSSCKDIFDQLNKRAIFRLTPVGCAIALSYWKSKKIDMDVNIWIN